MSNTFLSLAIYYGLVYIGVYYMIANFIAFVLTVANAYFWNSRYVFKADRAPAAIVKTYAMYGSTFLLGSLLLFVMVDVLGVSKWFAPLLNLCVTVPLNFVLSKFWVFRKTTDKSAKLQGQQEDGGDEK